MKRSRSCRKHCQTAQPARTRFCLTRQRWSSRATADLLAVRFDWRGVAGVERSEPPDTPVPGAHFVRPRPPKSIELCCGLVSRPNRLMLRRVETCGRINGAVRRPPHNTPTLLRDVGMAHVVPVCSVPCLTLAWAWEIAGLIGAWLALSAENLQRFNSGGSLRSTRPPKSIERSGPLAPAGGES